MGLEVLEFVMEAEEAFEIQIPDEDMLGIASPRLLIDYVAASLSAAANDVCRSQRAFYRLRKSLIDRVGCSRNCQNGLRQSVRRPGRRFGAWVDLLPHWQSYYEFAREVTRA